ncbi:redox-sensing transcriptional repressor Rex [candidate division KSB1 bacterium]|nr:MAG: redox-sensing transcriptional repressor Rex [candidate division KSB1 bacterium]
MQSNLPKPSVARLCVLYRFLEECQKNGIKTISSSQIANRLGLGSHSIRKDISYLGEMGDSGMGYDVEKLKSCISNKLGLHKERRACVVGLGRLGCSIMNYTGFTASGYRIVAGFDSNINKLETIRTDIDLYPSYEIVEVVKRKQIELAVVAVPAKSAQEVADRLIEGGVRGIVNFAPVIIKPKSPNVFVRNVDVVGEFDLLSALITLS